MNQDEARKREHVAAKASQVTEARRRWRALDSTPRAETSKPDERAIEALQRAEAEALRYEWRPYRSQIIPQKKASLLRASPRNSSRASACSPVSSWRPDNQFETACGLTSSTLATSERLPYSRLHHASSSLSSFLVRSGIDNTLQRYCKKSSLRRFCTCAATYIPPLGSLWQTRQNACGER